jgi:hypothetical protein
LLRTCSEPDITKLFNIDEELRRENENELKNQNSNSASKKLATIKMNNSNNNESSPLAGTIRLAKSLENINKDSIEVISVESQSSADESGDDLIEILSATLKKKIQTETNKNKEPDDEDVSNVRETMLSFLQDSKSKLNIFLRGFGT